MVIAFALLVGAWWYEKTGWHGVRIAAATMATASIIDAIAGKEIGHFLSQVTLRALQ